jgi:hypothetical protein
MSGTSASLGALRRGWRRFWFEPQSPTNLAVCRILFYAAVFLIFVGRDFSEWGGVSRVFWRPIPLFRALHLGQPSSELLQMIQLFWKVSLAASCLGVLTRFSTAGAFLSGTYLLGVLFTFGRYGHAKSILVLVMGILALSRCGDALSVDRWIRSRRGEPAPAPNAEYRWPIRLVWVVFAFVFFGGGLAKIRHAGLAWAMSDTLASYLVQAATPLARPAGPPLTDWGFWIARHVWLSRAIAAATLVIELGFPLALLARSLRMLIVPAAFLMQLGITALILPDFNNFLIAYVFWVPWDRIVDRFTERRAVRTLSAARVPLPAVSPRDEFPSDGLSS